MTYTEFRGEITKLLNEYDMYCSIPDASPRVDLEDSIDLLFEKVVESLKERKKEKKGT